MHQQNQPVVALVLCALLGVSGWYMISGEGINGRTSAGASSLSASSAAPSIW